jgi:hypothetical protein
MMSAFYPFRTSTLPGSDECWSSCRQTLRVGPSDFVPPPGRIPHVRNGSKGDAKPMSAIGSDAPALRPMLAESRWSAFGRVLREADVARELWPGLRFRSAVATFR